MKIVLVTRARTELREIGRHIASDNSSAASKLTDDIVGRCFALDEHPERGTVVAKRKGVEVRRLVHGRYLIFYSVVVDEVRIHRITHGARSPRALLKNLDLS